MMLSLTKLCESGYLTGLIIPLFFRYLGDGFLSLFVGNIRTIEHQKKSLSEHFDSIETIELTTPDSIGGAGGNGSDRAWLTIKTSENSVIPAFLKSRTSSTGESFFMNLFGVYPNEVHFYRFLQTPKGKAVIKLLPKGFFPEVYCAQFSPLMTDFTLILENVIENRSTDTVKVSLPALSPKEMYPLIRLRAVLKAQATFHATFAANNSFNNAPDTVWGGDKCSRPAFLQLIARSTLDNVEKRFPGMLSAETLETYRLFLDHFKIVRDEWSKGDLTLCHGDAHAGNYFFEEDCDPTTGAIRASVARLYDFQCVAMEHPMRDVVYHVMSSVSEDLVQEAGGDKKLLEHYLAEYTAAAQALPGGSGETPFTLSELWHHYRLHGCWVLAAWIISAGVGDKFFDYERAEFSVGRIGKACERIGVREVLEQVLSSAGVR